jgi:hypothetical protein
MTLAELLLEAAAAIPGLASSPSEGGADIDFRTADILVAVVTADGAGEFRLDPAVAAAARRTPDTSPSEHGPDWVRFAPATLDDHAADRAVAWLGSAARRAVRG